MNRWHRRMGRTQAEEIMGLADDLFGRCDRYSTFIYASARPMLGIRVQGDVKGYINAEGEVNVMVWVLTNQPLDESVADHFDLLLAYDPWSPKCTDFDYVLVASFSSGRVMTIATSITQFVVEQMVQLMRNSQCYHIKWYFPKERWLCTCNRDQDSFIWVESTIGEEPAENIEALDGQWIDKVLEEGK